MLQVRRILGVLLAATAVWLGWVFVHQVGLVREASSSAGPVRWTPFRADKIQPLLASGKSVFVDVTADWCFTCQYNEKAVLDSPEVAQVFQQQGMVLMKADWTNRDTAIGDYLKSFHRFGIPFYALYRPGKPPVVLSEFLTQRKVLQALQS